MKLAIMLHHGLGDVIMATETLIDVSESLYENDEVIILVKSKVEKEYINLLNLKPQIKIISLEYHGNKNNVIKVLLKLLNLRFKKIDIFITPHLIYSHYSWMIPFIVNAKKSVGPPGKSKGFTYVVGGKYLDFHKIKYYHQFFKLTGLSKIDSYNFDNVFKLDLVSNQNLPSELNKYIERDFIIVSPGSSPVEIHKRWVPEKYAKLINKIVDNYSNKRIIVLGSKPEGHLINEIISKSKYPNNIIGEYSLSLKQTMYVMSKSSLVISACTAAIHMASLLNIPLIGLYGPTNYSITGPWSKKSRIISKGFSCSPCYRKGFYLGCGTPYCMTKITVEEVFSVCEDIFNNKPYPLIPKIKTKNSFMFKK